MPRLNLVQCDQCLAIAEMTTVFLEDEDEETEVPPLAWRVVPLTPIAHPSSSWVWGYFCCSTCAALHPGVEESATQCGYVSGERTKAVEAERQAIRTSLEVLKRYPGCGGEE